MFEAFLTLFSEADVLFYILYILAIGLLIAEVFVPNFGLLGLGGVLISIIAIAMRCLHGENTSNEIVLYVLYSVIIILIIIAIMKLIRAGIARKNKVKYAMIDGNKVPLTPEGNPDYSFLLEEEGEVVSDLKPTGKARFEQGTFEVTTTKEYIYTGTRVRVDKVIAHKVVVRKISD